MSLTHAPHPTSAAADQPEPAVAPAAPAHLAPVAGLVVGSADDRAESDADALADRALRRLHAGAATAPPGSGPGTPSDDVHAHGPSCGHLRRSAAPTPGAVVGAAGGALDAATSGQISARTGGGRGLPDGLRQSMEGAFGTGLGHVRIHDDSTSASLNKAVSARAFTSGSDIFFGAGEYAPHDAVGQKVLAHELAHVVTEGGAAPLRRWPWSSDEDKKKAAEEKAESDRVAKEKAAEKEKKRIDDAAAKEVKEKAKADAKAAEAKAKADAKAAQAQAQADAKAKTTKDSATVSGHKKLETSTKEGYKTARAEGVAARQGMSETMLGGSESKVALAKALLEEQMAEAIESEQELAAELAAANPAWTEDQVLDEAYKQTWLVGFRAKNLLSVRPPRETVAERLVWQIRQSRTEAAVASASNEAEAGTRKLGIMFSKEVELTYEKYVVALQAAMAARPPLLPAVAGAQAQAAADERSKADAEAKAETEVWGAVPDKVREKRPLKNSALDIRAIMDARVRLAGTPREKDPTGLAKADALSEKAGGYVEQGAGVVGKIQSRIASKGQEEDTKLDAANTGDPLYTQDPLGAGALVDGAQKAAENLKSGNRSGEGPDFPQSVQTKAAEGIGTVTDVFTSLADSVDGILKFAKAAKASWGSNDPRKELGAAKAAFDGLDKLNTTAKSTAKFAVLIDSSIEDSVKQVIPGLNIVTAVLAVASNAMDLADKSMRMNETNTAMLEARLSDPDLARVNVLIYPLLRVASKFTKNLEQASWNTAISISQVVTSIATVASAGGFGIPAAVQMGVGVLDKLHTLGHFIATEYMTSLSLKASDASAGALEGSAEQVLTHNPGMAVDGIILRAAGSDPVAIKFLAKYEVDGAPVDEAMLKKVNRASAPKAPKAPLAKGPTAAGPQPATPAQPAVLEHDMLFKIRQAVLEVLGDDADPEYTYTKVVKELESNRDRVVDRWNATGAMADQRNRMDADGGDKDAGDRGLIFRLKMFVKGEEKFGRSQRKTDVNWDAAKKKNTVREDGVALICGPYQLPVRCTEADMKTFLDGVDSLSDKEIVEAATNKENSEEGRAILVKIVQDRLTKKKPHAGATA
ncbi:protein of unknown function [Sanguibacter gelidistatuariae]|uniref:eCIS core domain-containing protein n=1 Tax=Sanguibacter gelidistatuariae TaxID=1814289 RepID=A0A1G6MX61_9MICO|nr:DUF4157 domain-containing protein [Sanguibacter gelidistatuariae]SDC59515.1 protein of unknown function [Sanguibacter gelidistatuariae]